MTTVTQRQAVYNAISSIKTVDETTQTVLTKDESLKVKAILVEGFTNGEIAIDPTYNMSKINTYASGLISNWIKKDSRLNGGVKFQIKNPGSRAGSTDKSVAALKALLKQIGENHEKTAEVKEAIAKRVAEIKPGKAKPTIDAELLPEDLRVLLNS